MLNFTNYAQWTQDMSCAGSLFTISGTSEKAAYISREQGRQKVFFLLLGTDCFLTMENRPD